MSRPAERVAAAFVIAFFALVFLSKPIAHLSDGHLSSAVFSQRHALTRVEQNVLPEDAVASDAWTHEEPWLLFNAAEIARGRLPVWNSWNGGGVPHLANFRSAVFSPFSWPWYVLNAKLAAIVAAFLKLWIAGFFTYLFLRRIRVGFEGALASAALTMFSGQALVGLATSAGGVSAFLPAGLYALERLFGSVAADAIDAKERSRSTIVLALVLAGATLAGDPRMLAFVLGAWCAFAVGRSVLLAMRGHGAAMRGILVRVVACVVFAACVSAIQLLPWIEYARDVPGAGPPSPVEPMPGRAVELADWPLQFFPRLLGAPHHVVAIAYVSGIGLFLAVLALVVARKRGWLWVFAICAVEALAVACAFPADECALVAFSFSVAVGAAFAIDHAVEARARRPVLALGTCAAALGVLWTARSAAMSRALDQANSIESIAARRLVAADASAHVDAMCACFLVAIAFVCAAMIAREPRARRRLALAVSFVLAVPGAWLFRDWNRVTLDEHWFPRTTAIAALHEKLGARNLIVIGDDAIPPEANLAYGLRQLAVDDGYRIQRYDQLYRSMFGITVPDRGIRFGSELALQLFGVDCVLDRGRWPPIETAFGAASWDDSGTFGTGEILPGAPVVQEFAGIRDGLDGVRFVFTSDGKRSRFTLSVTLEDVATGERLVERSYAPGEVRSQGETTFPWVIQFPPIERAKGRHFRLSLASDDAREGGSFRVQGDRSWMLMWIDRAHWRAENAPAVGVHPSVALWKASQGQRELEGQLLLDLHHALRDFVPEGSVAGLGMYGFAKSCTRYHTVGRAIVTASDQASWDAVNAREFDPTKTVVLEGVDPALERRGEATDDVNEPVEIVSEDHGRVRLKTKRAAPGWLVTSMPWYPGWKARVGGVDVEIARANFAFLAVPVTAGESEVELAYEPASVRIGALISLATIVAGAVSTWIAFKRRP